MHSTIWHAHGEWDMQAGIWHAAAVWKASVHYQCDVPYCQDFAHVQELPAGCPAHVMLVMPADVPLATCRIPRLQPSLVSAMLPITSIVSANSMPTPQTSQMHCRSLNDHLHIWAISYSSIPPFSLRSPCRQP